MSRAEYSQASAQGVRRLAWNENKENADGSIASGKTKSDLSKLNEIIQLFKLPSHDSLHVRTGTLSSFIGQTKRIQSGTMENKPKLLQQSKTSFRSCGSFIHSKGNLRKTQSRTGLIKKMVYLTECALKDNNEIKHSTPVKILPVLTPRKTPRSYLVLPELERKVQNIDEMRAPLKDFIRQENVFGSSVKKNSAHVKPEIHPILPTKNDDDFNDSNTISELEFISVEGKVDVSQILEEFQKFNVQASKLHEEQRVLDDDFEKKIKDLPVYAIYEKFCQYQIQKQELSNKMKSVEDELSSAIKNQRNIHENVNFYIKENRKLLDERTKLHKEFQEVVQSAVKNCKNDKKLNIKNKVSEEKNILLAAGKPQLRRSLRLSKIPKKIDAQVSKKKISRGNQIARKSPCYKKGKVLE